VDNLAWPSYTATMIPFFVFVFGLAVGSFLNVVIYRMPARRSLGEGGEQRESVLKGRSYCPHCKHGLAWYDLIPLLSFLFLKGRCRYCPPSGDVPKGHKQRISFQYPLVELATGLLFLGTFLLIFPWFPQVLNLLYLWAIASLLVVIFVYDLKHYIIPDKVIFPAIGLAFFWRVFEQFEFGILDLFRISNFEFGISLPLVQSIVAGIGASLFFFAIYVFSKGRAMGFGDVKLAFFMGLFLGFPSILVALFVAFLFGGVLGLALILAKKKSMKSEVPFGPFLVLGTFVALFWGEHLLDWYLNMFLV